MDYKYIEQLLDRYWEAETTLEEERVLKAFFAQSEMPEHLLPLRQLFETQETLAKATLSDDFEAKILQKVEATIDTDAKPSAPIVVKAIRPTFAQRLRPFYNAAATIALFLLVGGAVQHSFNTTEPTWKVGSETQQGAPVADADSIRESLKTLRHVGSEAPTATAGDSAKALQKAKPFTPTE